MKSGAALFSLRGHEQIACRCNSIAPTHIQMERDKAYWLQPYKPPNRANPLIKCNPAFKLMAMFVIPIHDLLFLLA